MPAAVPVPVRQRLFDLADKEHPVSDIADILHLATRTVRRLLAQRQHLQSAGLQPAYHRCGRKAQLHPEAVQLRTEHPTWGAPYIRIVLEESAAELLPSTRTLQRHFAAAGLQPAPPGCRRARERQRAQAPHEVWQMDACERIPLRGGGQASWLRIADEYTGAFLQTRVFPPGLLATGASGTDAGSPA